MNTEVVIYKSRNLKFRIHLDNKDDAEQLSTHSIYLEGEGLTVRQFCNAAQIQQMRDACGDALAELQIIQATQAQAADIQAQLAKPQCACGRDLLTQTELKVQTCHICLTNDGTLLGEEQKYVPGALV